VFWRCLNRLRAGQERQGGQQGGSAQRSRSTETAEGEDELEEVLVSEQKLVTYLNCFVLHKNPRIGDEGVETHIKAMVNLWETQTLQGRNSFPHPRDGALIKAFTKALRTGRSALAAAKLDDAWKHSLRDGYDPDEHNKISKWYLGQAVADAQGSWARARFDFLMQHAIMGRSEDLRNAKLSSLYLHSSRPQASKAVVVSIKHSKTNTEARREFGIAARHKNEDVCPIGAMVFYFFDRFHVKKESFPDFSSRAAWYDIQLLVDEDERGGVTWSDQAKILRKAFEELNISSSKLTHTMRGAAARHAHEAGCSESSIRIHGRWTASGDQLIERYLTGIAVQPVRALSGFSISGGDHYLPRTLLDPPNDLARKLWPQVDEAETAVRARQAAGGEKDEAALAFLEMMRWLRLVLLQDAALLSTTYPSLPIWSMEPFTSTEFHAFRSALTTTISGTPHPLEVTVTEIIPRLGHALADLRSSVAETTEAFKQAISTQQAENDRLRLSFETAIATLSSSIERHDRADEARAMTQQVIMSSITALASASSSLESPHTSQHEQQQQTIQLLVRLLSNSTVSPALSGPPVSAATVPAASALSSPLSGSQSLELTGITPTSSSPSSPAVLSSSAAALTGPAPISSLVPPTTPLVPPATAPCPSLPAAPVLLPRTILCLAATVKTVNELAREWYEGRDGYMGICARLLAKDEGLASKGAAARKQICRWRRVIAVLEELVAQRGWRRPEAVAAIDHHLKHEKYGLRTLADQHLAKDETRLAWVQALLPPSSSSVSGS
ncbi:hypothetical protein A4X09_0g7453, partial [Tilletia walkeri]